LPCLFDRRIRSPPFWRNDALVAARVNVAAAA
jgi:hypothetical protein